MKCRTKTGERPNVRGKRERGGNIGKSRVGILLSFNSQFRRKGGEKHVGGKER